MRLVEAEVRIDAARDVRRAAEACIFEEAEPGVTVRRCICGTSVDRYYSIIGAQHKPDCLWLKLRKTAEELEYPVLLLLAREEKEGTPNLARSPRPAAAVLSGPRP